MAPRPQRPRDDFVGVVNDLVRRVRNLELGATGRRGGGVAATPAPPADGAFPPIQWTRLPLTGGARPVDTTWDPVAALPAPAIGFRGGDLEIAHFAGRFYFDPTAFWTQIAAGPDIPNAQGSGFAGGVIGHLAGDFTTQFTGILSSYYASLSLIVPSAAIGRTSLVWLLDGVTMRWMSGAAGAG